MAWVQDFLVVGDYSVDSLRATDPTCLRLKATGFSFKRINSDGCTQDEWNPEQHKLLGILACKTHKNKSLKLVMWKDGRWSNAKQGPTSYPSRDLWERDFSRKKHA